MRLVHSARCSVPAPHSYESRPSRRSRFHDEDEGRPRGRRAGGFHDDEDEGRSRGRRAGGFHDDDEEEASPRLGEVYQSDAPDRFKSGAHKVRKEEPVADLLGGGSAPAAGGFGDFGLEAESALEAAVG